MARPTSAAVFALSLLGALGVLGLDGTPRAMAYESAQAAEALPLSRATDGRLYTTVQLNGVDVRAMIDTGANISVLRPETARRIGLLPSGETRIRTAGGDLSVKTARVASVGLNGKRTDGVPFVISDTVSESLIGMDVLGRFGEITLAF